MSISLEQGRIDPEDPRFQQVLANLQCNILKSHGRDCAVHIFLKFTAPANQAKAWIRSFSGTHVTSALRQYQQSQTRKETSVSGGLVGSFFLSAEGYKYLGFDVDCFNDNDETFRDGMKHKDFDLLGRIVDITNKDPKPDEWDVGFQDAVHAMILLARDTHEALEANANEVMTDVAGVATVLTAEYGEVLRNDTLQPNGKGQAIEHFGYVDGRSIPVFLKGDVENDCDQWNPEANLSLVLIADPHAHVEDSFGSYFVFRKLEQNVEGFDLGVADLASKLGITTDLAGAFCVGRFADGTPVTLQATSGLGAVNDFEYKSNDKSGDKCPAHAHIRKRW